MSLSRHISPSGEEVHTAHTPSFDAVGSWRGAGGELTDGTEELLGTSGRLPSLTGQPRLPPPTPGHFTVLKGYRFGIKKLDSKNLTPEPDLNSSGLHSAPFHLYHF